MKSRVCGIAVKNSSVLLIRYDNEPPLFHIPGGGIKEGETLEEALMREYREELDLSVRVGRFLLLHDCYRNDGEYVIHIIFEVFIEEQLKPQINPANCSGCEVVWANAEEIKSIETYPHVENILHEYVSNYPDPPELRYQKGDCPDC